MFELRFVKSLFLLYAITQRRSVFVVGMYRSNFFFRNDVVFVIFLGSKFEKKCGDNDDAALN